MTLLVDTPAPTATVSSFAYDAMSNTLVITGSNFNTLLTSGETASSDIKSNLNWDRLSWDIDGDDAVTANVGFLVAYIPSAKAPCNTPLTIVLGRTKATQL